MGVSNNTASSSNSTSVILGSNIVSVPGTLGVGTSNPVTKVHVVGDLTTSGTVSAGTGLMFRNRIVNGDMRLDTQNAGAPAGTSGGSAMVATAMDKWTIAMAQNSPSITAQQVALSAADQATTEQTYAALITPAIIPLGLGAYYPFEGTLRDASGNNVVLSPFGTPLYVPGRVGGQALYLPNEGNVLATPTSATNYVTSPYTFPTIFSVALWFSATKLLSVPLCIFSTNAGSANLANALMIYLSSSIIVAGVQNVNSRSSGITASLNTWYHVAVTYNSGTYELYVNGTSYGSTSATFAQSGFMLGNQGTAYTYPFAGYIDDLRIYNRLLTATEVSALANFTPSLTTLPAASGLTQYYPFDGTLANSGTAGGSLTSSPTTISYAPGGIVGTQCLYLANETNVTNGTASTYYATSSYTFPSTFTVSFWAMSTKLNAANNAVPFATNNGSTILTNSIYVTFGGNGQFASGFWSGAGGSGYVSSFAINTWYHIALTYNSGTTLLYVNGSAYASFSGTLAQSGFMLGNGSTTSAANAFAGYLDDLRIYNSALTPAQIAALFYNTNATYTNFQQTIDGSALANLQWGTTGALPATLSAWIKNNASTAQAFSMSFNSTGLIGHLTFENIYDDAVGSGFLFAPRTTSSTTFTNTASQYKVGSYALNLTANTINSAAVAYVMYTVPSYIPLPLSVSLWFNAATTTGQANTQTILSFGAQGAWGLNIALYGTTGNLYTDLSPTGTFQTNIVPTANTWVHVCSVTTPNGTHTLYYNGAMVLQTPTTLSALSSTGALNTLFLGTRGDNSAICFKGYIDDVRIYNRALTATQVKALYDVNSVSTTQPTASSVTLPVRSLVYNTPAIAANSWQKLQIPLPADSNYPWDTRLGQNAATLSLCLGAGPSFNTSNIGTWGNQVEYIGSNTQQINNDSNAFLASSSNAVLVTGVQLEKGSLTTGYEYRHLMIERTIINDTRPYIYGTMSAATNASFTTFNSTKSNLITLSSSNTRIITVIPGLYAIGFNGILNGVANTRYDAYLYINGNVVAQSMGGDATGYAYRSLSYVYFLNINDNVYISPPPPGWYGYAWSTFYMYLIG